VSFEFKGTFNRSQFQRFVAFARSQLTVVDARIVHLSAEQGRVGALLFSYDAGGVPVGFVAEPADSYIGKLVGVYEVFGGDVLFDLHVRSMNQPVFLMKTDETTPAQLMSNGEVVGAPGLADGESAELMSQAREWVRPVLDYRLDHLERKIRRAIDYSDSLQGEINLLSLIKADKDIEDSFEYIADRVEQLFGDPSFRAIWDDQGKDKFGKLIYAPFLPFSSGTAREANSVYGRDERGATTPGEKQGS